LKLEEAPVETGEDTIEDEGIGEDTIGEETIGEDIP
jgi:hypothetical protein